MPPTPIQALARANRRPHEGVVFAVYAPFGTDPLLSRWPLARQAGIAQQPMVRYLKEVAAQGVNVSALIDLFDDDSWLVEIPAGQPQRMLISSAWKQDMGSPRALAGFLRRVHQRFPCQALVLAMEGHGAGFVPEIDPLRITPKETARTTGGGEVRWVFEEGKVSALNPDGSPVLPMGSPMLPMGSPMLPAARMPLSTWGLAEALRLARRAGVPRPAVIHFNNCFNMSFELLHTIAPLADVATGYGNYNFFTAGAGYPGVFRRLRQAGGATAEQLGQWFAAENAAGLRAKGNHPTVGASVRLARLKPLSLALDRMALALTAALRADPATRATIRSAILAAQQYDTNANQQLQTPDQLSDLGSLAVQLQRKFDAGSAVHTTAATVQTRLSGVWQYGDFDRPWTREAEVWDFRAQYLGVNLMLPDPALEGVWDWRSPYYLAGRADPVLPPAHKAQIPFLSERSGQPPPWVEFLIEYHRTTPLKGFLPALAPEFPVFNARFKPKFLPPKDPPGPNGSAPKGGGKTAR
jgi:hypothetical protein